MKFLLLKTLLLRKRKDEGFTLPIVIAIGLVMVLLSTVNLVQSGEESLNAVSQRGSSDALAAAELGVSRYRDLLINNRVLAVNDSDQWTTFNDQTCESIVSTGGGWADTSDATGWRDIELNEPTVGIDLNSDGDTTDNNVPIGSYRLVSYEYDQNPLDGDIDDDSDFDQVADANNDFSVPPDGESDAAGLLTVQGQDTTGSIAQIQVTIPLGVNTQDLIDLSPALWIQQPNSTASPYITNFGNVNVNGANVVLSRPSGSGDCAVIPTIAGLNNQNAVSDARNLPPLIDDLTGIPNKRTLNSTISSETGGTTINYFDSGDQEIILGTLLDDTGGTQALHTDGRYYYTTGVSNLNVGAGDSITADGESKVILHVGGNLVVDTGTGDTTNIANSQLGFKPDEIGRYLEIHVEGNVTINGTGTLNMTGLLRVGGTVNITDNSTVNILGAVWTNQWNNNGGGTVNITLDDHRFYSVTPNRTPAPLTYRPSGWETQEAN